MREIVVDIETTGLDPKKGDKIIEIACLELINHIPTEKYFHTYLNPQEQDISPGAFKVHGIEKDFLSDKPLFKEIAADFLVFIDEASVLAHNASFDIGFLNHELAKEKMKIIDDEKVIDTLKIARNKHPGMPNNLDALCKRYNVAEQKRGLHDAKSDCDLLAQVYIELIGGRQRNFKLTEDNINEYGAELKSKKIIREKRPSLSLTQMEINQHNEFINTLGGKVLWNGKDKN